MWLLRTRFETVVSKHYLGLHVVFELDLCWTFASNNLPPAQCHCNGERKYENRPVGHVLNSILLGVNCIIALEALQTKVSPKSRVIGLHCLCKLVGRCRSHSETNNLKRPKIVL